MHKEQFANTGAIKKSVSAFKLIFKNVKKHRSVKAQTKILLDIAAKRDGELQLNDDEKLTLYRNSVKFVLSYDPKKAEEGQALSVLS
jgi:hypothetical protein